MEYRLTIGTEHGTTSHTTAKDAPANDELLQVDIAATGDLSNPATASNIVRGGTASAKSSVTAIGGGDEQDEIGYSEDEAGLDDNEEDSAPIEAQNPPALLEVPVDDEITWESENEDARNEQKPTASAETVQVSPAPGKRTRSESIDLEGIREQIGEFFPSGAMHVLTG